jgi:ABC-2 type transport system ATP-binding protein
MNAAQAVSAAAAIQTQGLTKRYGELTAVDGLDLRIPSGQFFGLLGPNGSGKTTTIHMLATLIRPTSGSAHVAGFDVTRDAVRTRESIGIVFQESALDRSLTVSENLRFAGLLLDMPVKLIEERSQELLNLFGLEEHRNKSVATLSGGMRRALDIVRGVLHHPKVLFLDEPTIGLDLPSRRRIWRFIEKLRASTDMTVLLTTHYLEEADSCDQVSFIRKGRIVESGALEPLSIISESTFWKWKQRSLLSRSWRTSSGTASATETLRCSDGRRRTSRNSRHCSPRWLPNRVAGKSGIRI